MQMIVHLDSDIFDIVDKEVKNIECRLNDEKRRKLKIGDKLIFLKRPDDIEKIEVIIEDLVYYDNFDDMVKDYAIEQMYLPGFTKENFINLLSRFYSKEEQEKYGVVAIKFKKI